MNAAVAPASGTVASTVAPSRNCTLPVGLVPPETVAVNVTDWPNVDGLSVGVHAITAGYGGDADDSASTSAPVNQVVNGGGGGPQPPSGVKPIPVLPWPLLGLLAVLLGWLGVRQRK